MRHISEGTETVLDAAVHLQMHITALNHRSMSIRLPLLLSLLATVLAAEDPHASHDHGGEAGWEWAGIFATPEDFYLWTAQSQGGALHAS